MALLVLYRVKNGDNQLQVYFTDIRPGSSVWHNCMLPDSRWLIREISDQLTEMGFELESDRKLDAKGELQIFATHVIPDGAGSSADAIRTVCDRHAISAKIDTGVGEGLRHCFD